MNDTIMRGASSSSSSSFNPSFNHSFHRSINLFHKNLRTTSWEPLKFYCIYGGVTRALFVRGASSCIHFSWRLIEYRIYEHPGLCVSIQIPVKNPNSKASFDETEKGNCRLFKNCRPLRGNRFHKVSPDVPRVIDEISHLVKDGKASGATLEISLIGGGKVVGIADPSGAIGLAEEAVGIGIGLIDNIFLGEVNVAQDYLPGICGADCDWFCF